MLPKVSASWKSWKTRVVLAKRLTKPTCKTCPAGYYVIGSYLCCKCTGNKITTSSGSTSNVSS